MPGRLSSDLSTPRRTKVNGFTKICANRACPMKGKPQALGAFSGDKTRDDGLNHWCRVCDNEKAKQVRERRARRAQGEKVPDGRHAKGEGDPGALLQRLVDLTRKSPLPFEQLCDKLDVPPAKLRGLIEGARRQGMRIQVNGDHVGLDLSTIEERTHQTGIAPVVGDVQRVAVISDTHLGSKYCLRAQLVDFIEWAYAQGVRNVLHPGDVTDGDYSHGKFEMSHMGLEDQTRDLFEVLPKKKGLRYHAITGNHDFTFTEKSGVNVGAYIEGYFAKRGRDDIRFYGDRGAFLDILGAKIHLWHPRSGTSYALSYALQKQIEKYAPGEKPQILLAGHWHTRVLLEVRGVNAMACGTFQGGGSAFSKSLGGAPSIGGTLLQWGLTEDGTMRDFSVTFRSYFEVERLQKVGPDRSRGILVR